ncbi:MAG: hypothetical protein JWR54_220 [Mucilaginibacter sp.]|nr:hypothetical protein [Mucilaginibacter sp.]
MCGNINGSYLISAAGSNYFLAPGCLLYIAVYLIL